MQWVGTRYINTNDVNRKFFLVINSYKTPGLLC